MIEEVKLVVSDTPARHVWKSLRYFRDPLHASNFIRKFHGLNKGEHDANVKKQAVQAGYSIRQGEEYFAAGETSGLATRPTLYYYGIVSLTKALTLLRLDGTHSSDALRSTQRHNHHGLELNRGKVGQINPAQSVESILEMLACKPYLKQHRKNNSAHAQPWGHFALFLKSLKPAAVAVKRVQYIEGEQGTIEGFTPLICADIPELKQIYLQEFDCCRLAQTLPDMVDAVFECGMRPSISRGNARVDDMYHRAPTGPTAGQLTLSQRTYNFFIDGINDQRKKSLLEFLNAKNSELKIVMDIGAHLHLSISKRLEGGIPPNFGYLPDIVDSLADRKYLILDPTSYIPESAAMFCILFCFGMLSRYYADIWIRLIDNNVRFAEFAATLLDIVHQKFPRLILDQMMDARHLYIRS